MSDEKFELGNVLIVDSDTVMRDIIGRNLHKAGFKLGRVVKPSGSDTLMCLREIKFNLVLLDIVHGDGHAELIRDMKKIADQHQMPIVVLASKANEDLVERALAAGANGYIRKPVTPDQLKERLPQILEAAKRPAPRNSARPQPADDPA